MSMFKSNGLTSASCQTFAGAFDLGMSQAGFRMLHKVELKGGFGHQTVLANRDMIGDGEWTYEDTGPSSDVSGLFAPNVDVIVGNPPCSGFSVMSSAHFRGVDSPINSCMRALIAYAGMCKPQVVVMESVQAAFSEGFPLMRRLRDMFEASIPEYEGRVWLNHVLHNARLTGNTAERRRYFMVLTVDRPFVAHDSPRVLQAASSTLADAIQDLEDQPLVVEAHPYVAEARSTYAALAREDSYEVDGHFTGKKQWVSKVAGMLEEFGPAWGQGDYMSKVLTKHLDETGEIHHVYAHAKDKLLARRDPKHGLQMGFHQPTRWVYDRPARVITGAAGDSAVHPVANRMLTFREMARIMGYPDRWQIAPTADITAMPMWWGKQPCVEATKWIGDQITMWFDEREEERFDPDHGQPFPARYGMGAAGGPAERELIFDHTAWPRPEDGRVRLTGRIDETMLLESMRERGVI